MNQDKRDGPGAMRDRPVSSSLRVSLNQRQPRLPHRQWPPPRLPNRQWPAIPKVPRLPHRQWLPRLPHRQCPGPHWTGVSWSVAAAASPITPLAGKANAPDAPASPMPAVITLTAKIVRIVIFSFSFYPCRSQSCSITVGDSPCVL